MTNIAIPQIMRAHDRSLKKQGVSSWEFPSLIAVVHLISNNSSQ